MKDQLFPLSCILNFPQVLSASATNGGNSWYVFDILEVYITKTESAGDFCQL